MKVSCLPVSFFEDIDLGRMSIREWAALARDCGLDGIDLGMALLKNHTPEYLKKVASGLKEEGMPLVMLTTYPDFTHPEETQREREKEYFRRDIALASQLKARYLRITAGQAHPETELAQGIEWAVESFKDMEIVAGKYGIQLLFENHSKPGAWQYPDFSHPTEIFLEIYQRIKETDIHINFDTCNPYVYGNDALPILEKVMDRVDTLHVADTGRRGALDPAVIGRGIVPFEEIFRYLKKNSFTGWFCIEEASRTGRQGLEEAVSYVRETWEKIRV